ncbi:MAG: ABC transporter permease [Candidatus Bipolaricaulota bacterium]|nr:ABC transporter permease [Candidatus Bipolaricaulota bacterium]
MLTFAVRRFLQFIPTIIVVSIIIFLLMSVLPGDPAFLRAAAAKRGRVDTEAIEQLREKWGLNDPVPVRYLRWLGDLVRGDLGHSFRTGQEINDVLRERLPVTLRLAILSILIAVIGGVILGYIAAIYQGTIIDLSSMFLAVAGISIPEFWSGLMLILLVSVIWGLLPTGGYGGGDLAHMALPALTLGFRYMALIARITRSSMLDVINKDYIRTARAKGLAESIVRFKHIFRNSLIPILTIIGLESGWLFANTVVIEKVFTLPGIGHLLVTSILRRDVPVMEASILIVVLAFLSLNFAVDLLYGFLDPRIRYD